MPAHQVPLGVLAGLMMGKDSKGRGISGVKAGKNDQKGEVTDRRGTPLVSLLKKR